MVKAKVISDAANKIWSKWPFCLLGSAVTLTFAR